MMISRPKQKIKCKVKRR